MKYDIQHTCGHIYTYNIYGTNVRGERNRRRDFLASTSCTDCERKDLIEALKSRFSGIPDTEQGSKKKLPGLSQFVVRQRINFRIWQTWSIKTLLPQTLKWLRSDLKSSKRRYGIQIFSSGSITGERLLIKIGLTKKHSSVSLNTHPWNLIDRERSSWAKTF